ARWVFARGLEQFLVSLPRLFLVTRRENEGRASGTFFQDRCLAFLDVPVASRFLERAVLDGFVNFSDSEAAHFSASLIGFTMSNSFPRSSITLTATCP